MVTAMGALLLIILELLARGVRAKRRGIVPIFPRLPGPSEELCGDKGFAFFKFQQLCVGSDHIGDGFIIKLESLGHELVFEKFNMLLRVLLGFNI